MFREDTEWSQFYWFDSNTHNLPRILLIGDSIVSGYRACVAKLLKGKATIAAFSTSRIVGDPAFARELSLALADYPVDYIYFNNGLHGFQYDDDFYRKGLYGILDILRLNTRARIFWRSSTPITIPQKTDVLDPEKNAVVIRRNQIAAELVRKEGIPMDDLYSVMLNHPEYRSDDGYHYITPGVEAQGKHIAEFLTRAMEDNAFVYPLNGFQTDFPGHISDWNGFERYDFKLNGLKCILVKPNCPPDKSKHWFWRARFFGAFPYADYELLKRGWHTAHIEIDELYGSPESNRRFDLFYQFMVSIGFNRKCVPVGYSRGGLDVYNWSIRNPDKVSCLYLDNPVCDFKSWPGNKGHGPGAPKAWENCLDAWGYTEEQALACKENPIDNLKPLADAGIPVLHVCGDADEVVPPEDNTMIVENRYKALGGHIEVIHKPGAKHHPHCLENPQPIVDFILKYNS